VGDKVTVLNLDLLANTAYCDKKLQSANLKFNQSLESNDLPQLLSQQLPLENNNKYFYYALTLSKEYITSIKDNLYVVGLASTFSQAEFNNLLWIELNMGNRFLMDYLKMDFDQEGEFGAGKALSSNYYVPLILLRDFYASSSSYKGELQTDPKYVFLDPLISDRNNPNADKLFKVQFGLMEVNGIERQRALVTRLYSRTISERYATFDPDSKALEVPVRPINTKLYAGEYEITNELFNRFLGYLQKQGMNDLYERYKIDLSQYSEPALSFMKNYSTARVVTKKEKYFTQYPVVSISYEAANAYCDWLTEQYNKTPGRKFLKVKFRLPTVNEWQIAALGYKEFTSWMIDDNMVKVVIPDSPNDPFGKGTEKTVSVKDNEILYPWFKWYNFRNSAVNNKGCYLGNFKVPENVTPCQPAKMNTADGFLMMSPRGSYFPNDLGLFDVVGNVAEMTSEKGIAAGGSWNHAPEQSTIRSINEYSKPEAFVGFRVFMEVIEQ
ncbi:MAG TPA: SUMF1/EgtB/PvdO family nonheme iron enzyme, partial [Cyclobacteriaceae bacterium]|nr:SUMF1/EgtB/PvdO family nonheme iron enzyme [Cyclobacteriaceae bacterium]